MKKTTLIKFIEKYHLGAIVDSVKLEIKDKTVSVIFNASDKSLLGTVEMKDLQLQDAEIGIYTSAELLKILGAMSEELEVTLLETNGKFTNLQIIDGKDKDHKASYVLSDPTIIPKSGKIKSLPTFGVEMELTDDFISKFMKDKGAVESKTIAIKADNDTIEFILGYSDINTNRISFKSKGKTTEPLKHILFNAEYLKAVLTANKDFDKGTMFISKDGLMRLSFTEKDYSSEYFLVQLQMNV